MEKYKNAKVVSSAKAFPMMKNFFGTDFEDRRIVVGENDTLELYFQAFQQHQQVKVQI